MLSSRGPFVDTPATPQPPSPDYRQTMKRFLILACALATLAAGSALAQTRELSERGVLLDRVVAVVNDGVVLQSQVDGQVAMISERLTAQRAQLPPEQVLRQQILERLVLQEIQWQRAARLDGLR